jgi:ribosomal protein L3 glutamine methyltransferase
MQQLAPEFGHEPSMGLLAGSDGLDVVVLILKHAARHLDEKGILIVEVGHTQEILVAQFPEVPFVWLEFEYGGSGVFMLEAGQLEHFQPRFDEVVLQRATLDNSRGDQ